MAASFILTLSIALQFIAVFFALRLIKITRKSMAWSLIAIAVTLMALRRGISLIETLASAHATPPDMSAELVALTVSALMAIGIERITPIFVEIKTITDSLRESEERYRTLFESAPDAILIVDMESRKISNANPKAAALTGRPLAQIIGMHQSQLHPAAAAAYTEASFQKHAAEARAGIVSGSFEHVILRADGSEVPVEIMLQTVMMHGKPMFLAVLRDIAERKRAAAALKESSQWLALLFEQTPLAVIRWDSDFRIKEWNPAAEIIFGYAKAEAMGCHGMDLILPDSARPHVEHIWKSLLAEIGGQRSTNENITKDGRTIYCEWYNTPLLDSDGQIIGAGSLVQDVTEQKLAAENLRITASVFDNTQEAIMITDADNVIIDVNPAFTCITGYSRQEVIGKNPRLLSSGRQDQAFYNKMWGSLKQNMAWRGEIWNRRKSGEVYAEMLSISAISDNDGRLLRYVCVFSDISHIKEHEAELKHIAHFDTLTGIPNRVLLADRMKQAIAQTSREQGMMAVCYLDLDGFKPINDTLGHEIGDLVLIEVAKRIGNTIRGGDTVARLGGDEFVVLLLGQEQGEECVATLERLLEAIAQPITVKDKSPAISASIGVSIYPLDDEDPDTLLRHADQAMYVAKQSGKNRFHIYDPALDLRARDQHEFLKSIRHALEHEQFELHYQPKVNLRTRKLVGAEALIRWRHPERGLLPPAEFLRHIENTDLDIEIGEWVTATALAQIDRWLNAGLDIEVSINISGYHLESPEFLERLKLQMARYPDMPFGKLQIEVLETVALNDIVVVRGIIETCRTFGVGFALDDFGTGYSSLSYLSGLPVDALKIDQSFVRDMLEDKGDRAIVQGIIALARAFDRQTVAEGIETKDQYHMLLDMGCAVGQGYGIARPMSADKLAGWRGEALK